MLNRVAVYASGQAVPAVLPGDIFTYTLTVTNSFPLTAVHQVVLTTSLPLSLSLISATMPYTLDGDTIGWLWPLLSPGGSEAVEVVVQVDSDLASSPLMNEYESGSEETETIPGKTVETAVLYIKKYFPVLMKEP